MQALDDIEVAMKIIKRRTSDENPLDAHYKALNCDLEPLDRTNTDFKVSDVTQPNSVLSCMTFHSFLEPEAKTADCTRVLYLSVGQRVPTNDTCADAQSVQYEDSRPV